MARKLVIGRKGLRDNETWIVCTKARDVWGKLSTEKRAELRETVGFSVDNRIRGGADKEAYTKVQIHNANKWAEIAGIDPKTLTVAKPPEGYDAKKSPTSPDAEDYIATCKERIIASLSQSAPLLSHLCKTHFGDAATRDLDACADEIAEMLVEQPRPALEKLMTATQHFDGQHRQDALAIGAIRKITREIVLLIYDETEIMRLREALSAPASIALTIPAVSATAAEVVMARLDRRGALFEHSGELKWPRGKNAIPLPAESMQGTDYLTKMGEEIDKQLFSLTLDPDELALESADQKRKLAGVALKTRNIRKFGSLYCLLNLESGGKYRAPFQEKIDGLTAAWPAVRFVNLDSDPDRQFEEKALIWALREHLHDA